MANSTPSYSPHNALWFLEREFKTVWNFFFFFDWLNLKNRRYPYRSLCITVMNAPTQKESTNIIPSLFPLQIIFFCQRRKFVCILTRRCFLSFIAVSWTSCLRYAAGYLYWHCSLSGLATRSVYPIFMLKVSCFLAVNFIPVSAAPLLCAIRYGKSNSEGVCSAEFRAVLIGFSLRAKTRCHATTNQRRCRDSFRAMSMPYNFSLRMSHFSYGWIERVKQMAVLASAMSLVYQTSA